MKMKISKQRYKKLEAAFNDLTRLTDEYNKIIASINAQIETLEDLRSSIEDQADFLSEEASEIVDVRQDRLDHLTEDDEDHLIETLEEMIDAWSELTDLDSPDDQEPLEEYEISYLSSALPPRDP
tara:strand:+ start:697 stop:1071 length:375 start_codon:yes stop_codon:yes gene_type:complete